MTIHGVISVITSFGDSNSPSCAIYSLPYGLECLKVLFVEPSNQRSLICSVHLVRFRMPFFQDGHTGSNPVPNTSRITKILLLYLTYGKD